MDEWISPCKRMTLRLGRWQDVLSDITEVDAVITDPPYGERTHAGHTKNDWFDGANRRNAIEYAPMSEADVSDMVKAWASKNNGWAVFLTSHDLIESYTRHSRDADMYAFHPLPYVAPGSRVRLGGDGPSSWTCWIFVARPRVEPFTKWGTLPGAYILPKGFSEKLDIVGGKPLWLMKALIRDYSRPGDLICDPCAGSGTTLLAAAIEGRRAIGAEMSPETFALAVKRLSAGYTPMLFSTG